MTLLHLAADETAGFSTDDLVQRVRDSRRQMRALDEALSLLGSNPSAR